MTKLQTYFLLLIFSSFGLFASANDRWETLRAINMVENPTNQTGYGSRGELGPYQFRSSTWHMYSSKPFRMANDRQTADQVAVQHYEWIKEHLSAAGIDPNDYNIALAWNCGITAVISGHIPMQTYHYAERVNNLADSYHRPAAEEPVQVVVTTKSGSPQGGLEFKIADKTATPEFKIVSNPFVFRVAGETPHFVVAPAQPRFVLVAN
jgi:hypothetical protein